MAMCEKLIKVGKAYADDTKREQMQMERKALMESKCRNQMVDENLKMWQEMIVSTDKGVKFCVHGKLDMANPIASVRDPVYYRCNPHHVGSKYKVYPTYNFACPYVDSIEGVTHALRSSEYHDRNDQYYRVLEDMQLRRVHVWDFSRLNLCIRCSVNERCSGLWNDLPFPSVQGIIRGGLTIEALKQFILSQEWILLLYIFFLIVYDCASKNLNLMEWDKLWTINKKIIDPVCP